MKDCRNVIQVRDWMIVGNIKVNMDKGKIRQARATSLYLQVYLDACSGGPVFLLCRVFLEFGHTVSHEQWLKNGCRSKTS